jgi:hypothetical protein
MRFMYLGEGTVEMFGLTFKAGEPVEVTDEHAIKKLTHNQFFTSDEAPASDAVEAPKRRGRPPKVTNGTD